MRGREAQLRAWAAAALLALPLLVAWSGLTEEGDAGALALVAGLAALPALARMAPRRGRAAAAAATLVAILGGAALASPARLIDLLTLRSDAWGEVSGFVADCVRQGSDTTLPVDAGDAPALVGLLHVGAGALVALIVWQAAVRRRPVVAIALAGIGIGYRWTTVAPGRPVLAGALALAVALGALALASDRAMPAVPGRALRRLAVGGGLVLVAAAMAAGPARGGETGWWDWTSWDVSAGGGRYVIDLEQSYGKLDWPDEPAVVARVRADRASSLRAVVFEDFDGIRFVPRPAVSEALAVAGDGRVLLPRPSGGGGREVTQQVELVAGESPFVLATGHAVEIDAPIRGGIERVGDTIRLDPPFRAGDRYRLTALVSDPEPEALLSVRDYRPGDVDPDLIRIGFGPWEISTPLWGTGPPVDAQEFGAYAPVARLSREWIDDATSAYQAVNRIESRLRSQFVYDEKPPFPPAGTPALVDFLLTTRRGFCQQFAASMTLMLRMNGIPARVAVGFTGGRFTPGDDAFTILDRDAHSWVEVWFPEHGWVSFDPTPGRSAPTRASVSNPSYAPRTVDVDLGIESAPVRPPVEDVFPPSRRVEDHGPTGTPAGASGAEGGSRWTAVAAAVAGGLLLVGLIPGAKAVRRARARRTPDLRARVTGALVDLEGSLSDLGVRVDPALTPTERGEVLRRSAGIDARELYRRGAEARYGAREPDAAAARWAWAESERLRRTARRRAAPRRRAASFFRVVSIRRPLP